MKRLLPREAEQLYSLVRDDPDLSLHEFKRCVCVDPEPWRDYVAVRLSCGYVDEWYPIKREYWLRLKPDSLVTMREAGKAHSDVEMPLSDLQQKIEEDPFEIAFLANDGQLQLDRVSNVLLETLGLEYSPSSTDEEAPP